MIASMSGIKTQPSRKELERIAAVKPDLINALVAYFVMEWRGVITADPMHGEDQCGDVCLVPDYVKMWGIDACIEALRLSPTTRGPLEPGGITSWIATV